MEQHHGRLDVPTLIGIPGPLWMGLIGFLAMIPVAIVQQRINQIHAIAAPLAETNRRLRGWNWAAVILGIPLWLLVIVTLGDG